MEPLAQTGLLSWLSSGHSNLPVAVRTACCCNPSNDNLLYWPGHAKGNLTLPPTASHCKPSTKNLLSQAYNDSLPS